MRVHFDAAFVSGWEPLEGTFSLPDPTSTTNTLLVAAVGGAGAIVTDNLKDFQPI